MCNPFYFMKRTKEQHKALHLAFKLLANALNDAGLDQRVVLKPSIQIPWDTNSVKEQLWKPIMKAKTGKTSTTQLEKVGEIDDIYEILFRHLGEKFNIEYIEFPNEEEGEVDGKFKINN